VAAQDAGEMTEYQKLHAGHWGEPRTETGPDGKPIERRQWVFTDPRRPSYEAQNSHPASAAKTDFASENSGEKSDKFTGEKSNESGEFASEKPGEKSDKFASEKSEVFASEKSGEHQRNQPVTLKVYAGEKVIKIREIRPAKSPKKSPAKSRKKSGEKFGRTGRPRKSDLPDIGKYFYWKPVSDGFSLEHRPPIVNAAGEKSGQDYEYCGFLNPGDCQTLRGKKDEQEIVREIKRIIAAKRIVTFARRRSADRVARKSESA